MTKTVVVGITGSISAYKACDIISRLKKSGVDVRVILTKGGEAFITPLTLETLSGNPVYTDVLEEKVSGVVAHIELAKKADAFLIAPCSADVLGKMAHGIADDMLTTTVLATKAPIFIAPAMNSAMYLNPVVQENIEILKKRGCAFIEPESGILACGDTGVGRLADTAVIAQRITEALKIKRDLEGKHIVVTAGPTVEMIDPVRYITNRSSGKMGFAIANAAKERGARVTLITGPVNLKTDESITRVDITSSADLLEAVKTHFENADALIMAAAPADFTPLVVHDSKIKKGDSEFLELKLKKTADILKTVAQNKGERRIMGFAAETDNHESNASAKLAKKGIDCIALNDVSNKEIAFGSDDNAITLIYADGRSEFSGVKNKNLIAHWLLDRLF